MGAWWFVSYMYYQYIDSTHLNWKMSKSEASRRSVYNRTEEYHLSWLNEVLHMENLDVHGNAGNLSSIKIKKMAKELLDLLTNTDKMQARLAELQAEYERIRAQKS
jgi:hypothetical protein